MRQFAIFPAIMGSDQLLLLDGRWNTNSIRKACIQQAKRIQKFHSTKILRAEIYSGNRIFNATKRFELLWGSEDLKD